MPTKSQRLAAEANGLGQKKPRSMAPEEDALEQQARPDVGWWQEHAFAPRILNPAGVIALQRSIGNQAVQRMLGARRTGPATSNQIQRYVTAQKLATPTKTELKEHVGAEGVALEASKLHSNTRISDNRNAVLLLGDAAAEGSQDLYAHSSLIGPAQSALDKVGNSGSPINLTSGDERDFFGKKLVHIVPQFKDVGRFAELNQYKGTEGAKLYKEETKTMTAPLTELQDEVGEGELSWPKGDRGTDTKAKALNTFRDLLGEERFKTLKTKAVKLEPNVVEEIVDRLQVRIEEIQRLRGDPGEAKLILHKECIKAAHTVMGVTLGGSDRAIYTDSEGVEQTTDPEGRGDEGVQSLTKRIFELLEESLGKEGLAPMIKPHNELDEKEQKQRRILEMESGINAGANPLIGEGYGTVAHTWDPKFKKITGATGNWNMHWAAVVMKDGGDNITLENAADGPIAMDTSWWFQMFGTSKEGQTFHEQMLASNYFGNMATTLRVKPEKDPIVENTAKFDAGHFEEEAKLLLPTIEKRKNEHDQKAPLPLKKLSGRNVEDRLVVALTYAKAHLEPKVRTADKKRLAAWTKSVQDYINSDPLNSPIGKLNPPGTRLTLALADYVLKQLGKVKPG